jgi:hypothetical protein
MSIAFHTVFILNENIKWLEEFIVYYINLGISHFYLYDNEGSIGRNGSNKNVNKYGFPAKTTSDKKDRDEFSRILEKYNKYITHIIWQPRNHDNQIIYGMNDAIRNCIIRYGHLHEWVCFLDLDEFIFSPTNVNLNDYLNTLDKDVSAVKLIQKKFLDRFMSKAPYITQEYSCIDNLKIGTEWGPKNIVRCKDFVTCQNIHDIKTRKITIVADETILRFNHYNVNEKQLSWMKTFYKTKTTFKINGTDDGMKRYKHLFNQNTMANQPETQTLVVVPKNEQKEQIPRIYSKRPMSMFSLYSNIQNM